MEKKYFERFFIFIRPALMNYALSLTKNMDDAEELVQETYCKAASKYHTCKGKTSLKSWLYAILRNLFITQFQRKRLIKFVMPTSDQSFSLNEVADDRFRPDCEQNIRPYQKEVSKALFRIPRAFRQAVLLHDVEGLRYVDISKAEMVSLGTVRSRICRGRKLLRKELCVVARQEGLLDEDFIEKF